MITRRNMAQAATSRGHLNPGSGTTIARIPAPSDLAACVVHFWVPEWNLPPGETSRQMVLTYPVVNLVIQPDAPEGDVTLHGPRTRVSSRVLSGVGWAVGVLLRPAAVPSLLPTHARALVDAFVPLPEPDLLRDVASVMCSGDARRLEQAVARVAEWLRVRIRTAGAPDKDGLLANTLLEALDALPSVTNQQRTGESPRHVSELARQLGTSTRTLERVTLAHTGFTPAALVRRRRLQDAAERLRHDRKLDLARLAREVGYADHAHLTREFREVLGFTPSDYRDGNAALPS